MVDRARRPLTRGPEALPEAPPLQWATKLGVRTHPLHRRRSRGEPLAALLRPKRQPAGLTTNGLTLTKREWCERLGITRRALLVRRASRPPEEALTAPPARRGQR